MILVNNPGTWSAVYPPLLHAKWHGCTPTDLIFPFFLFIVGVAITLALSKRKKMEVDQKELLKKIIKRSLILFGLGLILNGFPYYDLSDIRIPGVLQRIAIVYLACALIFLRTNLRSQLIIAAGILLSYWLLMTLVPVPGVGHANLEPTTNLAAWLDRQLLYGHLWKVSEVWDPEGVLSTLPAVASGLTGLFAGHILIKNIKPTEKVVWLFIAGSMGIVIGLCWDIIFPLNKNIWTSSYVLYTSGIAFQGLALCYWFIDVLKYQQWSKPFVVYGANAITVFFLSGIVARVMFLIKVRDGNQTLSLKDWMFEYFYYSWLPTMDASLLWAITTVLLWLVPMWIMYRKRIFIKV